MTVFTLGTIDNNAPYTPSTPDHRHVGQTPGAPES